MKRITGILVLFFFAGMALSCTQKENLDPTPGSTNTDVPVSAIILNPTSLTLTEGESSTITATVSPSNASNQKVIWSSSDASVATVSDGKVSAIAKGSAVIIATADGNGKTAQCSVTVNTASGSGGGGGGDVSFSMEPVDLGLSVKWANANLGSDAIDGYGDYYAWGETKTKTSYTWANYKWCEGSETTMTKYNTSKDYGIVDNKGVLQTADDVAHAKLGGEWRIPTKAEWEELWHECEWTWTNINLVSGYLVTAENGNSIFLPAAGRWDQDGLEDVGSRCCYFSSSLYESYPCYAWGMYARSRDVDVDIAFDRFNGLSIRPVSGPCVLKDELSISVSVMSQSVCTVNISTGASKTYYVGIIEKSGWDEYGASYVVDFFIQDDKDNGTLSQCLYSGNQTFDVRDLTSKTEYVVYATFCNKSGQRDENIYWKSFTMK